jgi:hypothetical protein
MTSGRFEAGRLLDPRLTIACGFGQKRKLAFAWVQQRAGTRWLLVHDGGRRELYDVADEVPVRITIAEHVSERDATASADVDEISAVGKLTAREHLLVRLAG